MPLSSANFGKKLGDRTSYIVSNSKSSCLRWTSTCLMSKICRLYNTFFSHTDFFCPDLSTFSTWPLGGSSVTTILTYSSNGVIFSMRVWSLMFCSFSLGSPRRTGRWAQAFPTLWPWELTASLVSLCSHPPKCHAGKEVEENNKSNKKMMTIIPVVMIGDICHRVCHSFMLSYEIF